MTEKRYYLENFKDFTVITLRLYDRKIKHRHYDWLTESHKIVDLLNDLADENEQLKTQLQNTSDQRNEFHRAVRENANRVGKLEKENEQLKKGMIEVVDRYIRNVEHNPPSSARTYLKVKRALDNVREGLRDLLEDFE